MGKYPKIIELYGLPGCGKTTQCTMLKDLMKEKQVCYLSDVFDDFNKRSVLYKLCHIPYRACFTLLHIFFYAPKLPLSEKKVYVAFLRHVISYGCINGNGQYDFVIADHGVIQSIASLYYRNESSFSARTNKLLFSLLKKINFDFLIWCDISVDTSIKRIKVRNRNIGRFDAIKNDEQLRESLRKEYELFQLICEELKKVYPTKFLSTNMEEDPDIICHDLKKCISIGNDISA